MTFPITLSSNIQSHNGPIDRKIVLHSGFTVLLGPNGSGKTHFLRGLRAGLGPHVLEKKIRFLSAGRMGMLEQFRSDYDGQRGGSPRYDQARYGSTDDSNRRHANETLAGDFQTLAARTDIQVKIRERLRKLFRRDILIHWDAGYLKIEFSLLDGKSKPYSSGREASGLMHLVGILSTLYDDDVGALLVDEPEVSLHPQLQAFLLKEMHSVAGLPSKVGNKKLIIIATHSTEMLRIDSASDLPSIVFCHDLNTDPVQISPEAGELKSRKIQSLISRLGQEHKLSLFAARPLLVEGPSDAIICSAIASRSGKHLEASGSQILPVIGKGEMAVVMKLFKLLGKKPVAMVDADGVVDSLELVSEVLANNPSADADAAQSGASSAIILAKTVYSDFCGLVGREWASLAPIATKHPYWLNKTVGEAEAMRRAAFCTLFLTNDTDLSKLGRQSEWTIMKTRLSALLDLLERQSCFVLRKGTIESYYEASSSQDTLGKPAAAVEETQRIDQLTPSEVKLKYDDVYRCIKFASSTEEISEAEALKDLLLAAAAPAFSRFETGSSASEIQLLIQGILGDRANLFEFAIDKGEMLISMKSEILSIQGFPIRIVKGDDVIKKIESTLLLK